MHEHSPSLSESRLVITLLLALLVTIVGYASLDVFFPSLPAVATTYAVSSGMAQLTIALYLCSFGASQLCYGPLSDYYGRRPMLLIGFLVYILGSLLGIFSHSLTMLLIARFLQGLGMGAGSALARVIIRDLYVNNMMARMMSLLTVVIALAIARSPGLGGFIQQYYGYHGNLWFMLVFGAVVGLALYILLPETNTKLLPVPVNIQLIGRSYRQVLQHRLFLRYVLCAGAGLAVFIAYASINPFLLQTTYGMSPARYGAWTIIIASGELIGTLINAWLVLRNGLRKMLLIGFGIILGAGSMLCIAPDTLISVIALSFTVTMGAALVMPNAASGAFSIFKEQLGLVGALYGFLQMGLTAVASFTIAYLHLQTQFSLGVVFIVLALISITCYRLTSPDHQSRNNI